MAFTRDQKQKIGDAILAKRAQDAPPITCPVCQTSHWNIGDGFVRLVLQNEPTKIMLSGPSYPLVPLLCVNCGNTQLLNAFTLGVADMFGIEAGIPATLPEKKEGGNG
jgi:hypothetical protein